MRGAAAAAELAIEQAIARGLTATRIAAQLGVDADRVHAVWDRLDQVAADPTDDPPERPYVPPTYNTALAREGRTVEENATRARSCRSLLEQIVDAPRGPDCGSYAAYARHNRRREPVDPMCRLAYRYYAKVERRRERARKRAQVAA